MTSIIEAIKAKIDVVEEIGLVVALQKSGKALKGLCPFHNERTPSFYVFPESQTWRCFGCNEGGDIFTFVQKQQGIEFRETLSYLGEKAGVAVEETGSGRSPEEERELSAAKARLLKLNEDAQLWFHQMLLRSKEGEAARVYVRSRGISNDTVIAFGLGFVSERWDGLTRYLLSQGYGEREIVEAGLARMREERGESGFESGSGIYDYFRNRLIFPIRDIRGRLIGFGGRALGDGKPKYLNSPQTLLFEKNSVLYAIDMAREAIKQEKQVIIVEGYVDAVIAYQYGTKQTVACIGSAITEKHIQQLKKMTKQITLALDPDAAGSAATEHGIEEAYKALDRKLVPVPLQSSGRSKAQGKRGTSGTRGIVRLEEQVDAEINVLQLPLGEDPDEVIKRDYSAWLYAVNHPLSLVDWYFVTKTAGLDLREPSGKTEAAKRLLPVIGMISNRIKRDAYIRKLSALIAIDERTLYEELQKVLRTQKAGGTIARFSDAGPARSNGITWLEPDEKRGQAERELSLRSGSQGEEAPVLRSSQHHTTGLDRRNTNRLQWEDYLIGLLLQNPGLNAHVCGIINDGDFAGTDTRELYRILNSIGQRASFPSNQSFEQFVPSPLLAAVARAQKSVGSSFVKDGAGMAKEAIQCATRLKRSRLLQLITELENLKKEAAAAGDMHTVRQLQYQQQDITRQLRTINSAMHLQG